MVRQLSRCTRAISAASPTLAALTTSPTPAEREDREIVLPAGTVLPLTLESRVASDTSAVEDPVRAHLRRAQPVRVAHWLLAHFWALDRDRQRLFGAFERVAVLPLGSGAIAGSGFPVDRTLLKELLGFRSVTQNSLDSVGDRDWICDVVFTAALLGAHLSRIAEDLIVFSSEEFGFVKLPEAYTTRLRMKPVGGFEASANRSIQRSRLARSPVSKRIRFTSRSGCAP